MYFSTQRVWLLAVLILVFHLSFSDASETGFMHITSAASKQEVSLHRLSTGVDILCSVEASYMPNITWYFNNSLLHSPNTRRRVSVYNGTISLRDILNTTEPGVYSCRASGKLGSLRSHDNTVNVFAPPDLITPQSDSPVFVLSVSWSTILPCVSSLQSYFSVSWWFNGNLLKSHSKRYVSQKGNLHIYKARAGFTGPYYCTVVNKFTNENFSGPVIKLFVTNIQLPVYNTIPPIQQSSTLYVDAGGEINLEYNRLYEPLYNITWMLPAKYQPHMAPKLSNITVPSNYSVTVFVNERQKQTTNIQVKINSLPTVSMNIPSSHYLCNNSLLSLSCRTSATPQTTATSWYHNSKFLSTGDSLLLLLPLSTAEEGYYQCFAHNQLGSGSDASLLRFPIAPRVSIAQGREMQLSFGSPLTLTCGETEGVFQGIFRWTHSLLAELSEGNELYVPYVTVENSGEYTCSVNVCSIAASDSITVAVTDPVISISQLLHSPYTVNISWPLHPYALRYSVEHMQGEELRWNRLALTQQFYFVATQLQAAVRYTFRVSYILLAADGTEETQEYTSDTVQLDNPPLVTFVLPLSPTQLLIRWQWKGDLSSISSFVIEYGLSGTRRNLTLLANEIDATSYIQTLLSGLQPNSEYSINIYGVKHSASSWSTPYSTTEYSTTLPKKLTSSPPDLSVTYLPLLNSITIAFSQLNTTREYGEVLGYKILVFLGDFSFSGDFYLLSKNETSLTIPLSPGVEYYYIQVLAFNTAGDGPMAGLYFYPSNFSTEMTTAPTNSTLPYESWLLYLPYLIVVPVTICLTCVVIIFVLIGKCAHMYHLNSIKEEAEGVRAKRYYDTHYMLTRNSPTPRVKLQSEHKSVSSITHYKGSLTNPVRGRTRAYQAHMHSTAVETKFDSHTDTISLQTDPTCERPLTPESGRILADTGSVSSIPQQHDIIPTDSSHRTYMPLGPPHSSAKSTAARRDVPLSLGLHEFAV